MTTVCVVQGLDPVARCLAPDPGEIAVDTSSLSQASRIRPATAAVSQAALTAGGGANW